MTDRKNTYDKNDIIRREAVLVAGPLKIGAYRVRDLDTGEFGPMQIHMTYDNMVMAVLGESSARLLATFVDQNLPKHPEVALTKPSPYAMSPALVESGDVYVEVYPMKAEEHEGEQSSRLILAGEEANFYDVMLRPDDWEQNQGVPYGEWEDLTLEDAEKKVEELEALNPGIAVNWVDP